MERTKLNVAVGIFMLVGMAALAYLSIQLGRVSLFGGQGYVVTADFPSTGGLKSGAAVEIAGVQVGEVAGIGLHDDQARVVLRVRPGIKIPDDSIVSIKTKGLIGEKYVRISPGGSEKLVPANGRLREVEAPVDLEELISKYVFGKV